MKTLTLYLKITIFLLLIWMFQCFYNYDSYKTLIDKNIFQTKNELKYERALAEGDIAGKEQTNAAGCLEECSLDNKKNECKSPVQYENPCDEWHNVISPFLRKQFDEEAREMDPKWRDQKWNNEWNEISANKVSDLSSIYHQQDISEEEKKKKIDSVKKDLYKLFINFLDKFKKEMIDNKTESEYMKETIDNKKESESMKEMIENKNESESNEETIDNKTESESMKETIDNKTESESKNENGKNKIKNKKSNILKFLFKMFDNH
ncbi:fam-g protein [Plasmodium gallinaceum]|uniref:Fam-g protein n=1 Tax=Plasmodium gallinaceum TaxID=5849 RepID=A0A1J1GPW1_PLAGA|nr:fam-g protein [Plasmodium gallinaceum]CRG94485.1 fam-g protein [Plasmodium gallinaceum]